MILQESLLTGVSFPKNASVKITRPLSSLATVYTLPFDSIKSDSPTAPSDSQYAPSLVLSEKPLTPRSG